LGLSSSLVLLIIFLFPHPYIFFGILVAWCSLLVWLCVKKKLGKRSMVLLLVTALSFVVLLLLVESTVLKLFFVVMVGCVFAFLWYWLTRVEHSGVISLAHKPLRRIVAAVYACDMYACITALFALYLYFPQVPFMIISITGGLVASLLAFMIWNLYFSVPIRSVLIWMVVLALGIIELMWVMQLLPFGYLAIGFLLSWIWYVVQLFIRFRLSPQGIVWRKQIGFLISNAVLYGLVLYVIKWI
ncbi:MAG: hypothetical protein WCW33_06655, partial [Candidatus Babeliales bacterium]